jgi:uncharacterized protein (DUF2147 family)
MKRIYYVVMLMLVSSSAHAGDSFSFVLGGHRIRIEAPRYCNSPSCVSVSIPGIHDIRRRRDRYDDIDAVPETAAPARPPAPAPASSRLVVAPVTKAAAEPVAATPPAAAIIRTAASASQEVAAPSTPSVLPPKEGAMEPAKESAKAPPMAAPVTARITPAGETPADAARPAPEIAPQIPRISQAADDEPAATPLGDWRPEGQKAAVRIEQCGRALCGYVLDPISNAKGESVLINMKPKAEAPKADALWSGNIYSRDSGDTYYATIVMRGPNSLRVEACALGRFFCSGNVWSRIGARTQELITTRQISPEPRS